MGASLKGAAVAAIGAACLVPSGAEALQGGAGNRLVGTWVTVGQPCARGAGLRFRFDGRYISEVGGGRWTLRGNRLSLTNWGGGRNVPVEFLRNGRLVIRWNYGTETFRRC